uniref:Uncharacterized protein n=1 Tax=Anguilla anguilla TaxID=7936 RepID=A0A0E9XQU5_ANGAN
MFNTRQTSMQKGGLVFEKFISESSYAVFTVN